YVPLVRDDKESIIEMHERCMFWLRRGVPIMMFPEGTRSADGEVRPFKDGAFRMALEANCPLIPMVLTGTGDTLPKHGLMMKLRANCRVRVLAPVDPAAFGDDIDAFRDHVRALIIAEKRRMLSGARG